MRKLNRRLYLTFLSVVGGSVVATSIMLPHKAEAASGLLCENLFVASQPPPYVTVQITDVVRKTRGEEFFVLRRVGEGTTWSSLYAPHGFDRQGNLLAAYGIMGYDLATIIGYHENELGELFVPVPKTYNLRRARFNLFLRARGIAPIPLKWYEQPRATIVSYARGWEHLAQPVASGRTNHTKHDISFHYPTAVLPVEVAHLIQVEASILSKWLEFNNLDASSSAPFAVGRMDSFSTSGSYPDGHVPKKRLALQWSEHLGLTVSGNSHMSPFMTDELSHQLRAHLQENSPLKAFLKMVERYEHRPTERFATWVREHHPDWDASYAELGLRDIDQIHALYEKRAAELREAAHEFLKDPAYFPPGTP